MEFMKINFIMLERQKKVLEVEFNLFKKVDIQVGGGFYRKLFIFKLYEIYINFSLFEKGLF